MAHNLYTFSFKMNNQNNNFIRFLKKFVLLAVLLLILDFSIGALLKHYYFKQKFNSTTYIINDAKENFLVFGSSRAKHHYVPPVFSNKLNVSVFNCGRDGRLMIYDMALVTAILKRYTPKYLIMDLNPNELSVSEEGKLSSLLPYHDNPAIKKYLQYNSKFEYWKLLSRIYPYNSNIGKGETLDKTYDKGYVKFLTVMRYHKITPFTYHNEHINQNRIKLLGDFIQQLQKRNIKITIVVSPCYNTFANNEPNIKAFEDLCTRYKNVTFFNYENSPAFSDYKLYKDDYHLNDVGAHKFSDDLAAKLIAAGQTVAN